MDVVVVRDQSLATSGAIEAIRSCPEFQLRDICSCPSAVTSANSCGAVVVIDPFAHGDALTLPEVSTSAAVLVLTDRLLESDVRAALGRGVKGYLCKSVARDTLLHAVNAVGHGGFYLDNHLDGLIFSAAPPPLVEELQDCAQPRLTRRECEVLAMVAEGLTHKEIGRQLGLTKSTIDTYVYRISQKVSGANKAALTRLAVDLHLVSGPTLDVQLV